MIPLPAPGLQALRFTRSGFAAFAVDITVPDRRSLRLDVALDPVPVTLPPIRVASPSPRAAEIHSPDDVEIGLRRYTSEILRSNPLVSPDDPLMAVAAEGSADGQAIPPRTHDAIS